MKKLCVIILSIFTVYYSTYKKRFVIIPQMIKITVLPVYTPTQLWDNTDKREYICQYIKHLKAAGSESIKHTDDFIQRLEKWKKTQS